MSVQTLSLRRFFPPPSLRKLIISVLLRVVPGLLACGTFACRESADFSPTAPSRIETRIETQIDPQIETKRVPLGRLSEDETPQSLRSHASAPVKTPAGNQRIRNFREAKKILTKLHADRSLTLYCRCRYSGKRIDLRSCDYVPAKQPKRARTLEWEHVVPAEAFGQAFREWREGDPACVSKKRPYHGRRCAEKASAEFRRMEADLYNLFPEVGEVNGLRTNYSMAEVGALGKFGGITFGGCRAKIFERKFEPMDFAKGTVARAYLYMDAAYPGRGVVSRQNEKLFAAWDRMFPVEPWECDLYRKVRAIQGNENPVLAVRCATDGPI